MARMFLIKTSRQTKSFGSRVMPLAVASPCCAPSLQSSSTVRPLQRRGCRPGVIPRPFHGSLPRHRVALG